ncbi:MAG: hypothetical protein LBH75_08245, partial [Treponema sp.]|nr:hypothetical protein [Treponema sp.]
MASAAYHSRAAKSAGVSSSVTDSPASSSTKKPALCAYSAAAGGTTPPAIAPSSRLSTTSRGGYRRISSIFIIAYFPILFNPTAGSWNRLVIFALQAYCGEGAPQSFPLYHADLS